MTVNKILLTLILDWDFFILVGGSPMIVGPPEVSAQENTTVSLTCTYDTSETDPWYLSWNRNGTGLPYVDFRTKPCALLTNDIGATNRSQRYMITCNQTQSTYTTTLTIPAENVTEYEHKSLWRCYSFADNGASDTVLLHVIVPVKWIYLKALSDVFIKPGKVASFRCETSASRPGAFIQWYINGSLVTSSGYNVVSNFSGNSTDGPRVVTISTIQIPWEGGGWNQTVHCKAYNFNIVVSNSSTIINVSPGKPMISPTTNQSVFYEGDSMSFYCFQSGGNPPPLIQWGGACLNDSKIVTTSKTLLVHFNRNMNHELCHCKTVTYDRISANTAVIMTVISQPDVTNSKQQTQCSNLTFSKGAATGAGACTFLFSLVAVIIFLIGKRKQKLHDNQQQKASTDMTRNTYEDVQESKENTHEYMELGRTQSSENTYDNTDIQ